MAFLPNEKMFGTVVNYCNINGSDNSEVNDNIINIIIIVYIIVPAVFK